MDGLKTLKELNNQIILQRLMLFKWNNAKTAESLDVSYRFITGWRKDNAHLLPPEKVRSRKIHASRSEAGKFKPKKERQIDEYNEPTRREIDNWYNRNTY